MKEFIKGIFPPEVPEVTRWRLAVFALLVILCLHVPWSGGWLKPLGLGEGFAYAEQVAAISQQVSGIETQILEESLLQTRLRHCAAIKENKEDAKTFYWEKLQSLLARYAKITGREYRLPDCSEL